MSGFNKRVWLHGEQIDCSVIPLWDCGLLVECSIYRNDTNQDITNLVAQDEYERTERFAEDEGS